MMDYIPVWDEGVIFKKSETRDLLMIFEFIGVLAIPILGFTVFVWDFSPFSFLLLMLTS